MPGKRRATKKKSTKPDKRKIAGLTAEQVEAAEGLSRGVAPQVVAGRVGVSLRQVERWLVEPTFQTAMTFFREGAVEHVIKVKGAQEILEAAAPRAAETLIEVMEASDKDQVRVTASEGILDRTGHGKRTEIKQTIINLDAEAVKLIEETRRMAERAAPEAIPEAQFEELPPKGAEDDGTN